MQHSSLSSSINANASSSWSYDQQPNQQGSSDSSTSSMSAPLIPAHPPVSALPPPAAAAGPTTPNRSRQAASVASAAEITDGPFTFVDRQSVQRSIEKLFFDCLGRIRAQNNGDIAHSDMQLLDSLFPKDLVKALEIVQTNKVSTYVAAGSKRWYAKVQGGGNSAYTTSAFHCTCPAFSNMVTIHDSALYCKHQIAALLAEALNAHTVYVIDEALFGDNLFRAEMTPISGYSGRGGYSRGGGRGGRGGGGGGGRDRDDGGGYQQGGY